MTGEASAGPPGRVRYRFPPLERRGVIAGWRGGQVGTVAAGLVLAVLVLRSRPSLPGVVVAVALVGGSIALAFWPVAGRTGEQWLPVLARWASAGATGRRFQPDPRPGAGHRAVVGTGPGGTGVRVVPVRDRPPDTTVFGGLRIASTDGDGSRSMGMVVDGRARTVTAVLAVRGHSFALLGPGEQDARVASWARVLAAFAREGSAVHRLQWVERCVPDDGRSVRAHLDGHAVLGPGTSAARSYRSLLDESAPVTRRHRVLVAVTVHRGKSARAVRAAGGGLTGAATVLAREVIAVHRSLTAVDLAVEGVLGRRSLTRELAGALGPSPAGPAGGPDRSVHGDPWPTGVGVRWDAVLTDGAWHAVYWVSEWPRVDIHPDFLGPLLFAPLRRTLSVVMEPIDPARAARQVAQARTAGLADGELRRRNGFLSSARHAREHASVEDRDVELADGHAQFRFSGYVGVTADSESELVAACAALEQAAGQSRIEVRRLYGQQDAALVCLLPLGRGLS